MLSTEAYAFLKINHPLCAWATYRGKLVCAPSEPGFLSVWTAVMMHVNDPARINREFILEQARAAQFPDRISRLRGMFCFLDIASAERACSWATNPNSHFRAEYLAELHLGEAGPKRDRLDSNWITHAPMNEGFFTEHAWIPSYWAGEPYPNATPIWETLVEGRMIVLGTSLRERAYAAIKSHFPESLMFLEIARQAAWVGSDLGNVCAWLGQDGAELVLNYLMDMRDAENPDVLGRLERLNNSGHPINWADMAPHITKDSFGNLPDLRPFGFRRPPAGT